MQTSTQEVVSAQGSQAFVGRTPATSLWGQRAGGAWSHQGEWLKNSEVGVPGKCSQAWTLGLQFPPRALAFSSQRKPQKVAFVLGLGLRGGDGGFWPEYFLPGPWSLGTGASPGTWLPPRVTAAP